MLKLIEGVEIAIIPPGEGDDVKRFVEAEVDQFDKLLEWGLISKTAHQKRELKPFSYGIPGGNCKVPCEVVGYIPWKNSKEGNASIIISIFGNESVIHPAYLREMQGKTAEPKKKAKPKDTTGLPSDYIIYDIETTGISRQSDMIELAALKVSNHEIIDSFTSLIALPDDITPETDIATHIHGITFHMLKDAPAATDVLTTFLDFIGDLPLVGHNILSFDNMVLQGALEKYLKTSLTNASVDTVVLSRRYFSHLKSRTLGAMAEHFCVPYVGAHRAAADCEINYHVFLGIRDHMIENGLTATLQKSKAPVKKYGVSFKAETITTEKDAFDETHFLFGRNCALSDIDAKNEVAQLIKDAGGEPQNNVTRKTNILIHGDGATTGKVKKALEYNDKYNQDILILSQSEFQNRLKQEEADAK